MTATAKQWFPNPPDQPPAPNNQAIVIVGNGPVGVHCLRECLRLGVTGPFLIVGKEPHQPYNRVQLSAWLSGEVSLEQLDNPVPEIAGVAHLIGTAITHIDVAKKQIQDSQGQVYGYGTLILATGSSPHVPQVEGAQLGGVYKFRDMADAQRLFSRRVRSRHTVVVGGGLLGLEVAYGMLRHSTRVTLLHHSTHLMNRQLNPAAAERLKQHAESKGIAVRLTAAMAAVTGQAFVESVRLRDGGEIPCDTLVFATGIRPSIALARQAGLSVGQGIRVNEKLQTTQPDIYAIGECAEYSGHIFGLVGPGLEQASVLARHLAGNKADYQGSVLATELKVTGLPVYSIGDVAVEDGVSVLRKLEYQCEKHYRCLFLRRGKLVGAIGTGEWPQYKRVQQAVQQNTWLLPWQRWRFLSQGDVWADAGDDLNMLPASAVLCNCRQVTVGEIRSSIQQIPPESLSTEAISAACGAGSVCGTCQPLLQQLISEGDQSEVRGRLPLPLMIVGLLLMFYTVAFLGAPPLPVAQSVQEPQYSQWYQSTELRQWTGFTMLGLVILSMLVSARKRIQQFQWRSFDFWRWFHIGLTGLVSLILVAHTGLDTGSNLNQWLLLNFLAVLFLGGIAASSAALESALPRMRWKTWKRRLTRLHLIMVWPLPALLAYHILSVYFF